jgi:PAS domain S-box-containing protein
MLSPFTIEGRTIGIMALANKPGGFTGREVTLAQSFGELAAIALRSSLTRAALVKSEERIRQILNAIPAGLFTYQLEEDGRLVLIDANPAGLALTGIEWEQWKGRDSREIWIGPGSDEIHEKCFQAIQTGEPQRIEGFDYRCSRGGGTYNMVLFSIPGRKLGVGFENVTDRLRLEEELQRSRKLEAVGVLAGGIAHDFNNILMGVLGNISMAQYELNNPDLVRDLLEQAEKACGRARELTSQILTFSRGGAPVRKNVDITELIRESAGFALRGSNVKCEFDFAPGLWAAEVDENQVRQVLSNLIINADQAMPDGGRLRIEARNQELLEESSPLRPGPYVWISVHDQGVGIGEETLPRIFDPYFTTKQKGPGLGLATAYSIVNRHGGKITAESTIGAGSTFHVLLPAAARAEARGEPAPASLLAGQGRALVMDDEEMVRKVAVAMLDRLGFEADGAADGKEAIDKYCQALAAGEPYRLVIMDLTVPGSMGGVEAIKGLRELDPAVKAIVASGYSHDPVMANHRAYGFDGVAAKPFRLEELSQTLNQVLGPGPAGRPA